MVGSWVFVWTGVIKCSGSISSLTRYRYGFNKTSTGAIPTGPSLNIWQPMSRSWAMLTHINNHKHLEKLVGMAWNIYWVSNGFNFKSSLHDCYDAYRYKTPALCVWGQIIILLYYAWICMNKNNTWAKRQSCGPKLMYIHMGAAHAMSQTWNTSFALCHEVATRTWIIDLNMWVSSLKRLPHDPVFESIIGPIFAYSE
jgi:hypothetical protein